ncbi:hypothetical protein [Stenotrophomonas sp. NPDC078853]|uniref:hypothetical protein n=1 Tax=Stenotrophomonas sp. NPDC078853 TaxID=3364534 RepID=UPI00384C7612
MTAVLDKSLLQPGALPAVPERTGGDRMDNAIREHGIGNFCEWFGHEFDGEFAAFSVDVLQQRNEEAAQAQEGAA